VGALSIAVMVVLIKRQHGPAMSGCHAFGQAGWPGRATVVSLSPVRAEWRVMGLEGSILILGYVLPDEGSGYTIGKIGARGLQPNVWYGLDTNHNFVAVPAPNAEHPAEGEP
jgi:hypothetical protein